MAGNEWMYSGRISGTEKTDEWEWKTNMLVKELARGSKSGARPRCPCSHCRRRHPRGKDDMTRHLWLYGYMADYVTPVDFSEYERERGEVMRQRINGNEYDGIRSMLDDLRDGDMPDSPPPQEEEQEESDV